MDHQLNTMFSNPTRLSLKSDSRFNNYHIWKHKLRENCYKRVRENRTRLLWKMRFPTSQSCKKNQEDIVKSAFQDIVSDELKKMKDSSVHNMIEVPTSDSERDKKLWEYNGFHDTYKGDCEEILLEMQRIFYEDLEAEPTLNDSMSGTWEDEEDEYLARAVFQHMQLKEDPVHREEIWCPICKQGQLKDSRSLIYCSHCQLRLSKADELTLDFLRDRLAEAHAEHFDRGCRLKPKFSMESRFNLTALYISCEGCDTFEVVI